MIQDLKVGHLLGGTPWRMQLGEIAGVVFAALLMTIPLIVLHEGDIAAGGTGLGGEELPAPQAGLMALLAQGIVGGEMAWPLIVFGMAFCLMLLLVKAPSPMLIAVGMYLPLQTTFAIFAGGLMRWLFDNRLKKLGDVKEEDRYRAENTGTLLASGLIAGEALMGVALSAFVLFGVSFPTFVASPSGIPGLLVFVLLAWVLVQIPINQIRSKY
jgi:putative OPT family oligopeptide transporter